MFGILKKLFNRSDRRSISKAGAKPRIVNKSICQPRNKPHYRRTKEVYDVLDSVYFSGATYNYLKERVNQATGKSCSKKLISKWKLIRGYR